MGIGYVCKPNLKLAIVVWGGTVTWDDWRDHLQKMLLDPDYASMKLQITDLRFASIKATAEKDQIQGMLASAAALRQKVSLTKLAMVAGGEWGKPKIAELALKSLSVDSIVFNDPVTACVWLGVELRAGGSGYSADTPRASIRSVVAAAGILLRMEYGSR